MRHQLDIFGHREDDPDGVDVEGIREALASNPEPQHAQRPSDTRRAERAHRRTVRHRRNRRRWHTVIAVMVLVLLAGGIVGGWKAWRDQADQIPDFTGSGTTETVVRIQSGDSTGDIATRLAAAGVVASPRAFVNVAAGDQAMATISPGYYKVREHSSAQATVSALAAPANRVGRLRIIPGRQLADVTTTNDGRAATVPGYITAITEAACVPLNGKQDCFSADQLWRVEKTADPVDLGVVEWAIDGVRKAPDPATRLEGVILPGDYDVPPNSTPQQALRAVVSASAAAWNATDFISDAQQQGVKPYQAAIIASIVEREGVTADMPKVAQVIYNRLDKRMKLQMDSTVNYALGRAQIATTAADRANPSPYNTYRHVGLPPTPITSPGPDAVAAALSPQTGPWLYFVKIDKSGRSCFSVTSAEHEKCVARARANGVFG